MKSIRCPCGRPMVLPTLETLAATTLKCACGASLELATEDQVDYATFLRSSRSGKPWPAQTSFELLIPNDPLYPRLEPQAFANYLTAINRVLLRFLRRQETPEAIMVRVACGLVPGKPPLYEVVGGPDDCPAVTNLGELVKAVEQLPAPPLHHGPFAFALEGRRGNPVDLESVSLEDPFSRSNPSARSRSLEDRLLEVHGLRRYIPILGSVPASGWRAIVRHILARWWGRWNLLAWEQPNVDEPFPPPGFAVDLEAVTAKIEAFPLDSRWRQLRGKLLAAQGKWAEAATDLRAFVDDHPANTEARVLLARILWAASERSTALTELDQALRADPTHPHALSCRAECYEDLGALDAADADLTAWRQAHPLDPRALLQSSRLSALRLRYHEAMERATEALRLDPHWSDAHRHRARVRARIPSTADSWPSHHAAIEADMTAAVVEAPSDLGCRALRADLFLGNGRPVPALLDCAIGLTHAPDNPQLLGIRGAARVMLGDAQGAIDDCTRCRGAGIVSTALLTSMAKAHLMLNQFDEAQELSTAALELDEQTAYASYLRALAREQLGNLEGALEDISAAVQAAPQVAEWRAQRGHLLLATGDSEEAMAEADAALTQDPRLATASLVRAKIFCEQNNWKRAKAELDNCLEAAPGHAEAHYFRGAIFIRQHEPQWALADLDACIRLQPQVPAAYFTRAQVHVDLDALDLALADLDHLIDRYPTVGAAHGSRAHVWILKGEVDKAEADYREAVALEPGCAEALFAQRLLVETALLRKQERYPEAIERATEAIERAETATAYLARAAVLWCAEEFVEAIEDIDRAKQLEAEPFWVYVNRGQILSELGRPEEALADLELAADAAAPFGARVFDAVVADGRARALAGLGRFEEAAAQFEISVRLRPESAWVHYNHGLMYREMREWNKANVCFKLALALSDSPLPPRKRARAQAFVQHVEAVLPETS